MHYVNQSPEQLARDEINRQLLFCGWAVNDKKTINLSANIGVANCEFQASVGPADYVLFVKELKKFEPQEDYCLFPKLHGVTRCPSNKSFA